jgi:hypothetical protein
MAGHRSGFIFLQVELEKERIYTRYLMMTLV